MSADLGQVLRVQARHSEILRAPTVWRSQLRIFTVPDLLSPAEDCPVAGGFADADHQNDAEVQSAAEFAAKEVIH